MLNECQLCINFKKMTEKMHKQLPYMRGKSGPTDSLACRKISTFLVSPASPSEGP